MRLATNRFLLGLLCLGVAPGLLLAQPTSVSYQGQLDKDGAPFTGQADFKFAIVDGGTSLWSNDGTSTNGQQPTASVTLDVDQGLFQVLLGSGAMVPMTAPLFEGAIDPQLRIWVRAPAGGGEFEQLTDQKIASVPFSLRTDTGGSGGDSLWGSNGTDVYRTSGNVGIGTTAPGASIHVASENPDVKLEMNALGQARLINLTFVHGDTIVGDVFTDRTNQRLFLHGRAGVNFRTGELGSGSKLVLNPDGNVGIGTTNPTSTLDVVSTTGFRLRHSSEENSRVEIVTDTGTAYFNKRTVTANVSISLNAMCDDGDSDASVSFFRETNTTGRKMVPFFRGDATATQSARIGVDGESSFFQLHGGNVGIGTSTPGAKLDVAGTTRTTVLEITGADLVESFTTTDGEASAGDLVAIDSNHPGQLRISSEAYDKNVAGVVSGAGGVSAGIHLGKGSPLDGDTPVAMTGRVYAKCTTENGPIAPGDLLTTSSLPGHAMKATDQSRAWGAVIGKAMSSLTESEGLVLVLVQPQ